MRASQIACCVTHTLEMGFFAPIIHMAFLLASQKLADVAAEQHRALARRVARQLLLLATLLLLLVFVSVAHASDSRMKWSVSPADVLLRELEAAAPQPAVTMSLVAIPSAFQTNVCISTALILVLLVFLSAPVLVVSLAWVVTLRTVQLAGPLLQLHSFMKLHFAQMYLQAKQQHELGSESGQDAVAAFLPPLSMVVLGALVLLRVVMSMQRAQWSLKSHLHSRVSRQLFDGLLTFGICGLQGTLLSFSTVRATLMLAIELQAHRVMGDTTFWIAVLAFLGQRCDGIHAVVDTLMSLFNIGRCLWARMHAARWLCCVC